MLSGNKWRGPQCSTCLLLLCPHSEDPVFEEQLHTCCHLFLLLTLLPQSQMPLPPAQCSILLWLIMLMAISNFTGFTPSTGRGSSLHASCSYLHTHLLQLWLQSWSLVAQIFPLLDARTTETNLVLASWSLWVMKDIQPPSVSTWTCCIPQTTAEDRDAQAHVPLP